MSAPRMPKAMGLGSPRNGLDERRNYVYRGNRDSAEAEARLARIRAQLAEELGLDLDEDEDQP